MKHLINLLTIAIAIIVCTIICSITCTICNTAVDMFDSFMSTCFFRLAQGLSIYAAISGIITACISTKNN